MSCVGQKISVLQDGKKVIRAQLEPSMEFTLWKRAVGLEGICFSLFMFYRLR